MTNLESSTQKEVLAGEGPANFLRVLGLLIFVGSLALCGFSILVNDDFVTGIAGALGGTVTLGILYVLAAICDNVRYIASRQS